METPGKNVKAVPSMTWFRCLHCQFWTDFTCSFSVCIVNFEQVNAGCVRPTTSLKQLTIWAESSIVFLELNYITNKREHYLTNNFWYNNIVIFSLSQYYPHYISVIWYIGGEYLHGISISIITVKVYLKVLCSSLIIN